MHEDASIYKTSRRVYSCFRLLFAFGRDEIVITKLYYSAFSLQTRR